MKNFGLVVVALVALNTGAEGQARQTATPVTPATAGTDLTGTYAFLAIAPDGGGRSGRLVIGGVAGAYNGSVTPDEQDPAQVTSVKAEGSNVTIVATHNEASITLTLKATADSLVGTYNVVHGGGGESGDFKAAKIRS